MRNNHNKSNKLHADNELFVDKVILQMWNHFWRTPQLSDAVPIVCIDHFHFKTNKVIEWLFFQENRF